MPREDSHVSRRARGPIGLELLHLAGLTALSVTQPTCALIAANPQFLSSHAVHGWQLALLVAALTLLLPLVGVALELLVLAAAGPRPRAAVHGVLVAIFVAVLAQQVLTRTTTLVGDRWALAIAIVVGAGVSIAYCRSAAVHTLATFLSIAVVVVPAAFLFDERVRAFAATPPEPALFDVEAANPAPLVVVVFDELPLGSLLDTQGLTIDSALFPSFARLAASSYWFRGATTSGTFTELATPPLHTGRYIASDHLLPADLDNYPENLFTLLGAKYDVQALESTTHLVPPAITRSRAARGDADRRDASLLLADAGAIALHVTAPPSWRDRLPRIDHSWLGFWTTRDGDVGGSGPRSRVQQLGDFIAGLGPSSRPPFVYLHPLFPHFPWDYLPSGRRYYDLAADLPGYVDRWLDDEGLVMQGYQRHRLQVAAADRVLGELLDRLQALGWWENALVVVTSDHGVAFTAGAPRRELGPEHEDILRSEIMPVPLLIKLPHQREPRIDDRSVELIDVLPTIAEVLDLALPWKVDGSSLLDPARAERRVRQLQVKEPYVTLHLEAREHPSAGDLARERNGRFARMPDGSPDLFRVGPDDVRIGQPVAQAAVVPSAHRAVVRNENLFHQVSPDDARVPVFIRGELELGDGPAPRPGAPIGVAVNGVLWATTNVASKPSGTLAFSALVPEQALTAGENTVEVYLMLPDSTLARLDATGTQDVLRARWESSPTTLFTADDATGWDGFVGLLSTVVGTDPDGALTLESSGGVLRVELPHFDLGGVHSLVVSLDLECEGEATPIIYYMTEQEPFYRLGRMVIGRAAKGREVTFLAVSDPGLIGALSLDLGRSGRLRLHSVVVRTADAPAVGGGTS